MGFANVQSQYTLLVDTREKAALVFPDHLTVLSPNSNPQAQRTRTVRLHSVRSKMPEGDYALSGFEKTCIVERKGSILEVSQNCLSRDRPRFIRAIDRLAEVTANPVLILEGTPLTVARATRKSSESSCAIDSLLSCLAERNIQFVLLPNTSISQRRATAEFIARILLTYANLTVPPTVDSPDPELDECPHP